MQLNAFPKSLTRPLALPQVGRRPLRRLIRRLTPLLALALVLFGWQMVVLLEVYPAFIIPAPAAVLEKAVTVVGDGRLWLHASTTLAAVLSGLVVGVLAALVLGYAIAKSSLLDAVLSPLVVALQSTPVVAYAPLLIIWFGSGLTSKIVTGALIVFFPMLINTVVGIRGVPSDLRDLMRAMQATRWQTFIKLEVPAAMPVLLSGLKISATLAVIGAVVGEFVSANAGLGFLINLARSQYDTPLVIVAVLALTVMARLLYGLASLVERRALAWQARARRD
ncbi:MAG: riboflavin transport system permease protein RibX [Chloroflexota bacterium]|nr:MAG: riboflavin transport system permease protein RibX [Chloroflexota bacterium]